MVQYSINSKNKFHLQIHLDAQKWCVGTEVVVQMTAEVLEKPSSWVLKDASLPSPAVFQMEKGRECAPV
jgi:hypothetical protein